MALEAAVYPHQDSFSYGHKDCYSIDGGEGEGAWCYDFGSNLQEDDKTLLAFLNNNNIEQQQGLQANWECFSSPSVLMQHHAKEWDPKSPLNQPSTVDQSLTTGVTASTMEQPVPVTTTGRRKRRRTKSTKNKEEIENQRMTHIAVERNRRKQMNEYLAVLRSMMPSSYVQRGDQASIIGGAINFVKELEQLLQTIEAHNKTMKQQSDVNGGFSSPFAEFFTFPQYSTRATTQSPAATAEELVADQNQWAAVADIEVTLVESHANLKILSKKRPRQLLKMVMGLQSLRLSILHLNVTTTLDHMVLYSVSVKAEEGCQLNTVDEIAAAVHQLLRRIEEELLSAELYKP